MPMFKSKLRLVRPTPVGKAPRGNTSLARRMKQVGLIRRCPKKIQPSLQMEEEPISPLVRHASTVPRKTNCFRNLSQQMDRLLSVDRLQYLRSRRGKDEALHKFQLTHPFIEDDQEWAVNLFEEVERRQKKDEV